MKTVTVRDLRTRPKQVRESLAHEREALLTVNGRPVAVLLPVDAGTVDENVGDRAAGAGTRGGSGDPT